jgi:hypothetical protein
LTQTLYPVQFRPIEANPDGQTVKVLTGLQEFKLKSGSCGTYGGYGWHFTNWPIEKILTEKQKANVKQARALMAQGLVAEFKARFRVDSIPALIAFYADQTIKAKRLRPLKT